MSHANPTSGRPRLAVLLSGSGRTLDNLLEAIHDGALDASVAVVIGSRPCLGVRKAAQAGIETRIMRGTIPGAELGELLDDQGVSLVVLAGYLQKIEIPPSYEGRIVNIHPALLPDFGGPGMYGHHVHQAVIDAGRAESGCTVHLCDATYDTGPILEQSRCPVLPGDDADALAARVFELECALYPRVIASLLDRQRTGAA